MKHLYRRSRSFRELFLVTARGRSSSRGEDMYDIEFVDGSPDEKPMQKPSWTCFSYEELRQATKGFHQDNLVGKGGYAEVYRGELEDGRAIAVKRLTRDAGDERREKEFLTELGTVSHVRHPNVSALLGCCIDDDLHLVFEFSSRGSVSSHFGDESSPSLTWRLRYNIAVGTAKGLHYLHKECQRRIIHRDIKASNILLTENFQPQISDFGLAKWLPLEWTHRAVKPIEGTFGYLAPEYFMHGIVDEKTDVFAFGVFLLEMISGRKPVDGSHRSLLSWAKPYLSEAMVHLMVDARLGDDYDVNQLKQLAFVASLCIRTTASIRPSMTEVLKLVTEGEIQQRGWNITEEEEEEDIWDLDDLDECNSSTTTLTMSSSS